MTSTRTNHGWGAATIAAMGMILAAAMAAHAQVFRSLVDFDSANGAYPTAGLVEGADGSLYGTTSVGGATNNGTVFKVTPAGTLTTLHSFCTQGGCADGAAPLAGLLLATDGNLYGTTLFGGGNGGGVVFKITPQGTLTTLHFFCAQTGCTDGQWPAAGLVQAADGNFYGTTQFGGAGKAGIVFKMTPQGTLTTLYSFCSETGCTDGASPEAGLVQATDGNFYGTTSQQGANGHGTVFQITPTGALTTLYSFCAQSNCTDGYLSYAGLIQAADGNFYGTTYYGGSNGHGTIFKIAPTGLLTTLYSFCNQANCTDGINPYSGLAQATDGRFYGATYGGGEESDGTVFTITAAGTLTTLHSFDSTDGANLYSGLAQATNGNFYGTAYRGGTAQTCTGGCGTLFAFSMGLGPFVETVPTAGKAGKSIIIVGKLTGATAVTFNGTPATFTVELPTGIKATVPVGATTGPVQVVTPSGTLTSNVNFRVLP